MEEAVRQSFLWRDCASMFKYKKTQLLAEPSRKMRIRIGIEPMPEKYKLKAKRLGLDRGEKKRSQAERPGTV